MDTRALGPLQASVVGLGCNNFGMLIDEPSSRAVVDAALDCGINYFDTADIYGNGQSEEFLGRALGSRRSEVLIGTKFGTARVVPEGIRPGSAEWVSQSAENCMRRLGTDYLDHFSLHTPDPTTPIEETLGALNDLVVAGKVKAVGCSNFSADQLEESARVASQEGFAPFVSVQNHYSVLTRAPETEGVLHACTRHGVAMVPFFPLESGLLSGKYSDGIPEGSRLAKWGSRASMFIDDDRLAIVSRLTAFAAERGHTILELAMSWLASNPLVATIISGATKPEQVRSNVGAVGWSMSDDERARVDELLRG